MMKFVVTLLLIATVVLTGFTGETIPPGIYAELTQYDNLALLLTGVEEQDKSLLLRGVLVREVLMPDEVAYARTNGTFQMNGEIFYYSPGVEGHSASGFLRNPRTRMEITLMAVGSHEYNGEHVYMMYIDTGEDWAKFYKKTEMYRQIKIDKDTTVRADWYHIGYAHEIFADFTPFSAIDGVITGDLFVFTFEDDSLVSIINVGTAEQWRGARFEPNDQHLYRSVMLNNNTIWQMLLFTTTLPYYTDKVVVDAYLLPNWCALSAP